MDLSTLKQLTGLSSPIQEEHELAHPHLSHAEIQRLEEKFGIMDQHLEALQKIVEEVTVVGDEAFKLHHLGMKGDLDMGAFDSFKKKVDELDDELRDMHMNWVTSIQQHTDPAFQDDDGP